MLTKIAAGDEVATAGAARQVVEVGDQYLTRRSEVSERRERQAAEIPGFAASPQGDGQGRMISYPAGRLRSLRSCSRSGFFWRSQFVREESALQLARYAPRCCRPTAPISDAARVERRQPTGSFLDQGRLTLRFASKQDQ